MNEMALPQWVRVGSGARVGASATTIKTPVVVLKSDLVDYLDKLDPYVEAFNNDVKNKTYNVSSEPIAKTISLARGDGASDERITNEVDLVKTWRGWGFDDSSGNPEHPGFYRAWSDMSSKIRSGDYSSIWPWLVFGPVAGLFLVPTILYGYAADSAESRGSAWNNIRDAHKRLGLEREDLISIGYKPSGGELPDVPGDAGPLGITPLGNEKGKGSAQSFLESIPWGWVVFGGVMIAGAIFIAQVRGIFK